MLAHFRPEFINRLDNIIYFSALSEKEIVQIVRLQIGAVVQRVAAQGIELCVTDGAHEEIASVGFNREFGARPIRRAISQQIVNRLATFLLNSPGIKKVTVDYVNGEWVVQ